MNLLIVFAITGQMQLQVRIKTRRARPPSFQLLRVCIDPVCKPGENEKIKQNSILPLLQTTVKKVFWSRPLAGSYRIRFRGWSATASCRAHGGPGQGALHKTERRDSLSVKSEELRSSTFPLNELCLTSLLGALLPHPPPLPPASPLFVSTAWECQLPLVEDAAYTVLIISPFLSLTLSHTPSLSRTAGFAKTPSKLMQILFERCEVQRAGFFPHLMKICETHPNLRKCAD